MIVYFKYTKAPSPFALSGNDSGPPCYDLETICLLDS